MNKITRKLYGMEPYEFISEHFDITPNTVYLEFAINGLFFYYEFDNNHKIREKTVYDFTIENLRKNFAPGLLGESIQGTYERAVKI